MNNLQKTEKSTIDDHDDTIPLLSGTKRRSPLRSISKTLTTLLRMGKVIPALPAIETTPILLIRFTSKASPELIRLVKERLNEDQVLVITEEKDSDGNVMLGISITQQVLELEAEHLNLLKPSTLRGLTGTLEVFEGTVIMEPFEVSERQSFILDLDETKDTMTVYDSIRIFNSADRIMILNNLIESLSILRPNNDSSLLARKLNDESLHLPSTEIASTFHKLYLFDTLRNKGFVDAIVPLHRLSLRQNILSETLNFKSKVPLRAIRDYYGEEVAFYFGWMDFYTHALLYPGISGIIIFIVRMIRGGTIDTDTLIPFHGLFTFIWAIMFTQCWAREEARLSYKWGTWSMEGRKESLSVRHEFEGTLKISEVTKMMEKYYPTNKRKLDYLFSALVTLVLLAGAFFVMILSLNMQGYIKHTCDTGAWYSQQNEDLHHPFYFEFFANLSEKGAIFDSQNLISSTLAVILHVTLIMSMNAIYRKIAKYLTDWENHESQVTYNNSLICKRFFFEAFDAYLVLMYLAFYEQDVTKVRSELVNVFNVDTFRRILLEGVVPYIQTKIRLHYKLQGNRENKKHDISDESDESWMEEEVNKEEYEEFDDYIEMIIQLGYVCLFASAYPLAPCLAVLANFIEIRLDAFKLSHVHRRPVPTPVGGIGVWASLVKCIVWLSAFTNCMIFCFSSMQMVQYLPDYFIIDKTGEHDLKDGNGWVVVFIIFGIERFLLLVGIILCLVIPDVPEEVKIKEQQKNFIQMRMHHINRLQTFSKKDE